MSVNKDKAKLLFDATSQDYGINNFDSFVESLNDDVKRKEFFEMAGAKYNIGNNIDEFEEKLGIKKKILAEETLQPNLEKPILTQLEQIIPQLEPKDGGEELPRSSAKQPSSSPSESQLPSPSEGKPVYNLGNTALDIKANAKKYADQFYSTTKKKVDDAMSEYNSQVAWLNNEINAGGITRMEVNSLSSGFKRQAERKIEKAKEEYNNQIAEINNQAGSLLQKFNAAVPNSSPVAPSQALNANTGDPLKGLRGSDKAKVAERANQIGIDPEALYAAVNDFDGDDEVILKKAKEFATNRAEYNKSKAAYTWRNLLKTTMKNSGVPDDEANIKINYVTKLQQLDIDPQTNQSIPATYESSFNRVSKIGDVIKQNITNEGDLREALRALNVDAYAVMYQGMKDQNVVNNWAKTGNGNVFVGAGLDMLRLTDPERAKTLLERIQNQYATNEDKALYQRELENIGLNAIAFEVNRNLNRATQSEKSPSESFISALNNWKTLAEKTKASQVNRYGDVIGADIDRTLYDVTEGLETSTGEKAIYNIATGMTEWLDRGISAIWDYTTKNQEQRVAADMKRDHSKYVTEEILNYADVGSTMREAEYIPKLVDPEIKKRVDEVMANTSLDRDEKYKQIYPLIKNAYINGGIEFFSNPNKGNINLTSKNILHLLSTSGARSIGNVIPAVMTGGGASTALIAGLDAAAMKYDEQFREGSNDPLARSIRTGLTVGALAGIMDEAAALSKAFKGGSASLVSRPTAISSAKTFGTNILKEEGEELLTEALDGDVVKNWKEVVLSTAIISPIFAGPTAIIDNRRSSDMYRQLWFEAGASPELAKNGLNRMLNEGAINTTQFNEASKRVDRMAQIVANMPKTDMNGKPLSDAQKAKYADNLMKKYDAKSIPDTLPTKVAEQIKADAEKADAENASILEGQAAPELSTTEDKTTEQISKQDQIKQKNEFITDADFVQEAFTPEEDAADREALPESQFKTEEELSDFLANGQYAMLTGQNPEATPLSKDANRKLNEKAQQWLSSRGLTAIPIFGKYGNSERSFMVPNMTKQQAVEFAKEFQQESVAHSSGLVYQDGSFNPRTEGVDISPRFDQGGDFFSTINVGGKKVDFSINYDFDTKVEPKKALYESLRKRMFGDVGQKVASAQKALEKTGVVINMIQDPAEFDRTVAQFGGQKGIEGVFVSDQGQIFINQSKLDQGIADGRVIWHESSHPVVNIIRNTNRQLFDKVVSGLKQASKNNKGVMDALTWAETNYAQDGQGVVDDEAVVETIAGIAEGTIDIQALPTGVKQSIIEFINRIARALGFDQVLDDTDIAAFKKLASDVANALSTGQDISEIVGAENVKEYLNTVEAPGIVTGGELNKATQSRVTAEPAVNVYASKDVSALPQKSLTEIYEQFGGKAVVINSDPTRVGTLTLPSGKTIFMYGGPAYLSVKDNVDGNVGFATTQISKVNTWMNYVKEVFGDQPGVTLVASQAPTSILSNSYALRYVMDGISQLPKSVLKSSDFKNEFFGKDLVLLKDAFGEKAYNEFVNKYKKADLSNPEVIDAMISEMAYKVGDDNKPASFKARGAFVSNLLGGLAEKASLKGVEGDKGYVSKKPNKFIAKQMMDRLGINAEKVMREIGEPSLVEQYMNEGNWGFAVAGFETDPNITVESVQNGGVKHPLFNAKFPGKNPFILDGAYDLDQMFTPVEMTGPSGMPYTKTASQMLAGSMYVKGQPISGQGSFEYKNVSPSGRRIQSSKGNRVTRAMENVSNQMTEDGQGNYVFYHYSNKDIKKIDPSKFGRNLATGRDERPGVGLSMYYTRPDIMEANVPSEFGYVVRIPKNKVYPFNDDPLNLLPEAEKQFKKQFPDQAFDFNKQVGFVTKVAADRGYPMTVAEWNVGRKKALRAQTTESMKPEKFKENVFEDGYLQEKINPKLDFVPNAKKRAQMSKGNRDNEIRQFIRENIGQYSPDEISQAIQDEIGISKADADAMVAAESKGQAPLAEEIKTFQEGQGEEKPRAMADQFDNLAPEVESQIDDEARTYFAKTNKQTDEEVDKFIEGKDMAALADYVVSNPNIPGRVKIWMAAKVAKNLGRDIEAARANGDQAEVARLSEKQANIYNTFAREATELGQAVQAFVAFNDDPNAVNFFLNKILRQLKEKGVESITDQQRNDIIGLMQAVNNARPGLPKNKAIIQLSHYLGRLAPVNIGDVLQSIWYAHILSGVTTQLKNIYANTTMLALELPIGATWQSMKNRSLMPFVYAFKGLGAGLAKGIVKGADILRAGVTEKDANKFFGTEPVLEYFSWKQTKLGKLGGGAVGKLLDFPLFIGISPKTLKMVGRALAGADAFFSTTAQEAMANMLAYNQAVAEGKSGITPNGYRRVQELLGNTKQTIQDSEATAVSEGFKPGTIEYKRRVIELVTQTRNEQNQVAAEEFGKRVTLTNEPEGFTRGIYQVATAIQQYMPIARVVIPFTRIVSNISEMIINYSPAGAYRALTGIKNPKLSFKFSPTGDNKLSDEARGELFLKSSMAIAAVALLMDNVGDDEEDWFDITGGGPTDFQKKYELMKGGWRPYTIKLKDGRYVSYADWPIAGALSGLGTMRDIQQYEKEDVKKNESRLGLAAYGYLTAFYDKSLIKGISDFVDLFRLKGKYGPDATSLEKFEKFMANQAKALGMTNFSQQVFKLIQEYNDDPIKEAKGWETLYRDLPVINDGLNPIIDVFGDPVTPSTTERLLPWLTVADEKKDAMIEMLNKKGIFIGIPEEKPFVELETRTEREMTRDELYQYRKMAGEYTKAILLNRIDDISNAADKYEGEFKQKAWEKMIGNVVGVARKRAYVDLLMNKKTDINKLFEDLNQE